MITEDYVSYEIAKLLKEKGFEGDINAYYHIWDNGNKVCSVQEFSHSEAPHLYIPAPTHQMAMKWLRETRDIAISIFPTIETDMIVREDYNYAIYKNKTVVYQSCSTSYEETVETAIKYCLENLI